MHIIKWFIEKVKNVVQAYQDNRSRRQVEKWYTANEVTDEQLRLDHEQMMADYQQQCREEDERQAREAKEILEEQREDRRIEEALAWEKAEQILCERESAARELAEEYWYQELVREWQCQDCGGSVSTCTCTPDDDKLEVPQMGLPTHEEEEIPLWLEHANEECPNCGLLPEFCQCQYEE